MDSLQTTEFASARYFKLKTLKESSDGPDVIGRRLIFAGPGGRYHVTGDPIIYIRDVASQLTVGHTSLDTPLIHADEPLSVDDCDCNGQSLRHCDFGGQSLRRCDRQR
jgi:hypothetical protein